MSLTDVIQHCTFSVVYSYVICYLNVYFLFVSFYRWLKLMCPASSLTSLGPYCEDHSLSVHFMLLLLDFLLKNDIVLTNCVLKH